jgi:cell division protein FtsW (lipid II flippase)
MSTPSAVAAAACFVWLGMVLAISFLEAPLKFRAPGVTLPIGLGIGRLVFRALNTVEVLLALVLLVAALAEHPPQRVVITGATAVAALIVQLVAVRPRLTRRSDMVVAGEDAPRSRSHHLYIGLELIKVGAVLGTGALLLAS